MDNKLDSFFKNKMDEREIVFNEAHWEQAELMLDQQVEADKKRAWWKAWFLGLLGFAILAGVGCYLVFGDWTRTEEKNQSLSIQNTRDTDQNNSTLHLPESTPKPNAASASPIPESADVSILNEFQATNESPNESADPQSFSNKSTSNPSLFGFKPNSTTAANPTTVEKFTQNISKAKNEISPFKSPSNSVSNSSTIDSTISTILTSNQAPSIIEQETETVSPNNYKEEEFSSPTSNNESDPSTMVTTTNDLSKNKAASTLTKQAAKNIAYLEDDLAFLALPPKEITPFVPDIKTPQTKPFLQKKWSVGVTASILMYPYSNSSDQQFSDFPDLHPTVNAQHFNGYKFGMTTHYHPSNRWAICAELLYYKQTGTFQSVRSSQQIHYRFGAQQTTFELVPQSLHYVEIPLLLVRKFHPHALEVGLSTDILLGVKNAIGTYQNTDLAEPTLQSDRTSWRYQDGFSKLHFRGLIGYQYQLSKRMQVGLRMNYTLGNGLLDKDHDAPYVFILLESRPVNFELKMSYQF